MTPFKAFFESRNNEHIDVFYGTVICITSDNGQHTVWYLDKENVLKCASSMAYTITKVQAD
jgi:hypothetical protein